MRIYRVTAAFPREELFGMTSQMRRSASSVPHNIAEGCGRLSIAAELGRFIVIAMGSASELHSQTLLAHDLGYLSEPDKASLLDDIIRLRKMLTAYYRSLKPNSHDPKPPSPQDPA